MMLSFKENVSYPETILLGSFRPPNGNLSFFPNV
jgi:hypothetical protein